MTRRASLVGRRASRRTRDARYEFDQSWLATLRPTSWVKDYAVGAGQTYATVTDALAAISTDRSDAEHGRTPAPWWRCRILVHPGTYTERLAVPAFIDIVGASGEADDVVIQCAAVYGQPAYSVRGFNYVANVTLVQTDNPDISGHDSTVTLPVTGARFGTTIFENCCIIHRFFGVDGLAASYAIGGYGQDQSTWIFYRCRIIQFSIGQVENLVPNYAAAAYDETRNGSAAVIHIDCEFNQLRPEAGMNFTITDSGSGCGDTEAIIGGKFSGGCLQDAFSMPWKYGSILDYDNEFYYDPATTKNVVIQKENQYGDASNSQDYDQTAHAEVYDLNDYPARTPVSGMTPLSYDYHYPNNIGSPATLTADVGDASDSTLTANRIYYVPVLVPAAYIVTSVGVEEGADASGHYSTALYLDQYTFATGPLYYRWQHGHPRSRWSWGGHQLVLPGMVVVYAAFICDSGTAEFACSSAINGDYSVYYEDAGAYDFVQQSTPMELPAETPFPVLSLNCS